MPLAYVLLLTFTEDYRIERLQPPLALWHGARPVLTLPRDRPYYLKCDASRTAIGAVLTQKADDGKTEHAIGYFGKVLTESQARLFGVTELELYAIVEACKHYRCYLFGREFTIVTDHEPIRYCLTMASRADAAGSSRIHRWLVYLSELTFNVVYTPGRYNSVPDGISRLTTNPGGEMDEDEYIERIEAAYTTAAEQLRPRTAATGARALTRRRRGWGHDAVGVWVVRIRKRRERADGAMHGALHNGLPRRRKRPILILARVDC